MTTNNYIYEKNIHIQNVIYTLTKHLSQNILAIQVEIVGQKITWKQIYSVPVAKGLKRPIAMLSAIRVNLEIEINHWISLYDGLSMGLDSSSVTILYSEHYTTRHRIKNANYPSTQGIVTILVL